MTTSKTAIRLLWLAIAPLIFFVDTITDADVTVSVLYAILVLLIIRTKNKAQIVQSGIYFAFLTTASYAVSPGLLHPDVTALSDLALSFITISTTSYLGVRLVDAETAALALRSRVAQASRSASLDALAIAIAHEINQPLAATVANTGAAQRWLGCTPPLLDEATAALAAARQSAERAGEIVNGLRRLAFRGSPSLVNCDIAGLVRETVDLVLPDAEDQQVSIDMRLASTIPPIDADRILLQQAFLNVLANAMEAMETAGTRQRKIDVSAVEKEGRVLVAFADNGPGPGSEPADRLFEPFFTTKPGGAGVGLALTRSIADAHAAKVTARPGVASGLVVEFSFSRHEGETQPHD